METIKQRIQALMITLMNQPAFRSVEHWYRALSRRDQTILKGLGLFCISVLLVVLFIIPVIDDRATNIKRREKAQALYELIANNADQFGDATRKPAGDGSLLSTVTALAARNNISLSRYERGDNGLRIWLENVAFDDAITWLELLKSDANIHSEQINIDRANVQGRVNIRATLVR